MLTSSFWDGHTDYRVKITEEEENEKLESFANWIEGGDSDYVCLLNSSILICDSTISTSLKYTQTNNLLNLYLNYL